MKNYQQPLVSTVFKEGLFFRCQATANCNADINSCNTFQISDISIQDCEFTVCIQTAAFVPDETGSIVFDCGGAQQFTADFINVDTVLGGCTIPGGPVGNLHTITVDITPDLPDTCNGDMIIYFVNSTDPDACV
jgi:hypothetical protein